MGFKTWLYHNDHGGKIFDSDMVTELEKQGWRDSPAKLAEVVRMVEIDEVEIDDVMQLIQQKEKDVENKARGRVKKL